MRELTLVVVVAGDKMEKVLSGTDELLRVASAQVAIVKVTEEYMLSWQ